MNRFFKLICLAGVVLTPACATLGGSDQAGLEETARVASLEAEVSRLTAENRKLAGEIDTLRRERRMAQADAQPAELTAPPSAEIAELAPPLRDETAKPAQKPQSTIVVDAARAPEIAETATPVAEQPRLVQPTFASADSVFESEAEDGFDLSSVLYGVHLASYREREQARDGWNKLQRENPDELGLLEPRVEEVSIEGRGDFLRLIGGGFASSEKAHELCANLHSKGLFCSVVGFEGAPLSLTAGDRLR